MRGRGSLRESAWERQCAAGKGNKDKEKEKKDRGVGECQQEKIGGIYSVSKKCSGRAQ